MSTKKGRDRVASLSTKGIQRLRREKEEWEYLGHLPQGANQHSGGRIMADVADEAAQEFEQHLTAAIASRAKPLPPSPVCRNGDCGEKSLAGTSYCCKECREDAEKVAWAKSQRRAA